MSSFSSGIMLELFLFFLFIFTIALAFIIVIKQSKKLEKQLQSMHEELYSQKMESLHKWHSFCSSTIAMYAINLGNLEPSGKLYKECIEFRNIWMPKLYNQLNELSEKDLQEVLMTFKGKHKYWEKELMRMLPKQGTESRGKLQRLTLAYQIVCSSFRV